MTSPDDMFPAHRMKEPESPHSAEEATAQAAAGELSQSTPVAGPPYLTDGRAYVGAPPRVLSGKGEPVLDPHWAQDGGAAGLGGAPSPLLRFFTYDHLPEGPMRVASQLCSSLAYDLDALLPPGPEKTTALRKLLEAKDCAVRAQLPA